MKNFDVSVYCQKEHGQEMMAQSKNTEFIKSHLDKCDKSNIHVFVIDIKKSKGGTKRLQFLRKENVKEIYDYISDPSVYAVRLVQKESKIMPVFFCKAEQTVGEGMKKTEELGIVLQDRI